MMISEDAGDNEIEGVGVCSVAAKEKAKIFQHDTIDKNMNWTVGPSFKYCILFYDFLKFYSKGEQRPACFA